MKNFKKPLFAICFALLTLNSAAQNSQMNLLASTFSNSNSSIGILKGNSTSHRNFRLQNSDGLSQRNVQNGLTSGFSKSLEYKKPISYSLFTQNSTRISTRNLWSDLSASRHSENEQLTLDVNQKEPFFRNRRNVYSSLWAFASLNYLYADIIGLMDAHVHQQYENGEVDGTKITPEFLTVAGVFMHPEL